MALIKPEQLRSGSYSISGSFSGSFYGDGSGLSNLPVPIVNTSSLVTTSSFNAFTSSINSFTASYNTGSFTGTFTGTSSYATVANSVNNLNQNVFISGSLTVLQGATIYGSSSFQYVTSSQLSVSASFISVNVFEPAQRFGGLIIYDSGSSTATASFAWDSLHNHFIYQNASGSSYNGGMFLSGPRNTGSLGDEPTLTKWYIARSDGGDHLNDTQIYSSGSTHIVTGSLTVTAGITGSLSGSALTATSASYASTASYVAGASSFPYTGSALITGSLGVTGSISLLAYTASSANVFNIRNSANTANLFQVNGNKSFNLADSIYSDGFTTYLASTTGVLQIQASGNGLSLTSNFASALNGTNNVSLQTNSQNRLYVDNTGSIGIGNTTPAARLDVRAQGSASSDTAFRVRNNANTLSFIDILGTGDINLTPGTLGSVVISKDANNVPTIANITTGYKWHNFYTSYIYSALDGNNGYEGRIDLGRYNGAVRTRFVCSGDSYLEYSNLVIGATTAGARLDVRAQGSASSDTAFRVRNNANTNNIFSVLGNNTLFFTGSATITGSINVTQNVTSSRTFISSSNGTVSGSTLTVYGSGSTQPVFTVQGSQGELFSVTDSLSGSLFSVNDISGLPILEVFSDNTTLIGNYLDPMLITTAKVTQTNSGSFVLYSLPTASYDTAFFEYSVKSGSNARAGTIMAIQSGASVNFTEVTSSQFGSTSAISFTVIVTGSNMALTGSSTSGAWTIKTIVRGL